MSSNVCYKLDENRQWKQTELNSLEGNKGLSIQLITPPTPCRGESADVCDSSEPGDGPLAAIAPLLEAPDSEDMITQYLTTVVEHLKEYPPEPLSSLNHAEAVQLLIALGADVNYKKPESGFSLRHLVATSKAKNRDYILYLFNEVGAKRCEPSSSQCGPGCSADGHDDGKPLESPPTKGDDGLQKFVDDLKAHAREEFRTGSTQRNRARVLSLDGGGIRGLILAQLLEAILKKTDGTILDYFNWIAGTSTGAFMALALAIGKTPRDCIGYYLNMKSKVFGGLGSLIHSYDKKPLHDFLKEMFQKDTKLSSINNSTVKVLIPSVLKNTTPPELYRFSNYEQSFSANEYLGQLIKEPSTVSTSWTDANDPPIWLAARASGAAPWYFPPCGPFVDGGLLANNPTLEVMSEILKLNLTKEPKDQPGPMRYVVSLGTGRPMGSEAKINYMFHPLQWLQDKLLPMVKIQHDDVNVVELLLNVVGSSSCDVQQVPILCGSLGVPYFRFDPILTDTVDLDCKDDQTLIKMMWETRVYIHKQDERLNQLAQLLTESAASTQSTRKRKGDNEEGDSGAKKGRC